MKALLIQPPFENMITTNIPSFVDEERGLNPPISLLYVASYTNKHTKHKVEVLDCSAEGVNYSNLKATIRERNPDIVGIQALTFTLIDAIKTAKIAKELGIPVVVGGQHVNIYPRETINLGVFDFVVLGEGEKIFAELLDNFNNNIKLKKVKGLVFKEKGKIINTGLPELIKDLDSIPFPDRELTPYKKYYSLISKENPISLMITSRGCPFRCNFCNRPHLGKRFRARSARNVVNEMEYCEKLGIKEVLFYDDTFTINKKRVFDICNEIKKRKLKIKWDIRARVDTINYELIKALKEAKCQRIHYGVEAGTNRILRNLNKGITVQQVKKTFEETRKAKLSTLAYFMIGNPGEKRKDIKQTMKLARELKPDYVHISVTTPYPATVLYDNALKKGIIKKDIWQEFAKKPTKKFIPKLWTENFTREELISTLKEFYNDFYMRPGYILKQFLRVRSIRELTRKAKAGIKLLTTK